MKSISYYFLLATILFVTSIDSLYSQKLIREIVAPKNLPGTYEEILYQTSAELMDENRVLYLGRGLDRTKINLFFAEINTGKFFQYSPSILDFFETNPQYLKEGSELGKGVKYSLLFKNVLFFNRNRNEAGILIENSSFKHFVGKKHLLVIWNISEDKVIDVQTVDESFSKSAPYLFIKNLGTDNNGSLYYYLFRKLSDKKDSDIETEIFKYSNQKITSLYKFNTKVYPSHSHYDPNLNKFLILEYAESHENKNPSAISYDVKTNSVLRFKIPYVPYGAIYSQDGKRIFIASAQTGELRIISADTGKKISSKKIGTHGHAMGYWKDGEVAWIRNSGIHIYDDKNFKQKKVISTRKYFPKGSVNVSGSMVDSSFGIILRNSFSQKGEDYRVLQAGK